VNQGVSGASANYSEGKKVNEIRALIKARPVSGIHSKKGATEIQITPNRNVRTRYLPANNDNGSCRCRTTFRTPSRSTM
jgi:hypothetical protein